MSDGNDAADHQRMHTMTATDTFEISIVHAVHDGHASIRWVYPTYRPRPDYGNERMDTVHVTVYPPSGGFRTRAEVRMGGQLVGTIDDRPGAGVEVIGHGWTTWLRSSRLRYDLIRIVHSAAEKAGIDWYW